MTLRVVGTIVALALAVPAFAADWQGTGQVVCSECWFEAKRPEIPYGTDADLDCAARCAEDGVPPALAVAGEDGEYELILLDGAPPGGGAWLDWIAARVRAEGEISGGRDPKARRSLRVTSIERRAERSDWRGLGGHRLSLEALRGRVVVLNFWATWCAPCRKEMPDLARVQSRWAMRGVQVVGASADPPERGSEVEAMARRLDVNFPVVLGASTADMAAFGVGPALPATVVIDAGGEVVARFSGVVEADELERVLESLFAGEPTARAVEGPARVAARAEASLVPS